MPAAIKAALFGRETTGPIVPDSGDVAALTYEHAREMEALLTDHVYLARCRRLGVAPETGRAPRDDAAREALERRLETALNETTGRYQDCLAVYEEAFGEDAAEQLDQHVRGSVVFPEPSPAQQSLFDSP